MTINREDIKKLVVQQMLQESIQEEGAVSDWFNKFSDKFNKGAEYVKASQKGASKDGQKPLDFNKKLQLVADFIQMNRDSKLVKDSDLGKMLFSANPLQEAYESQLLKLMKDKKIDEKDVDHFIFQMSKNEQARKQLQDLGLNVPAQASAAASTQKQAEPETEVSDDMIVGSTPNKEEPSTAAQKQEIPDLVPGMEVKTKKAKINFLPPVEDAPNPEAAKEVAKTSADRAAQLKQKFDSGKATAGEKDELLALMGIGKQKTVKRKTTKKQPVKKGTTVPLQKGMMKAGGRLGESLQEAIIEEIYNFLTGKTK